MCELEGGTILTTLPCESIESILRKEFKALSYFYNHSRYFVPLNVQPTQEQLLYAYTASHLETLLLARFGNNPLETLVGPAKLMLDRSLDAIGFHGTHKVMARLDLGDDGVKVDTNIVEVDADIVVGKYRDNTLMFVTSSFFCPVGSLSRLVQTPEQTEAVHAFATSLRTRIEKADTAYAAR